MMLTLILPQNGGDRLVHSANGVSTNTSFASWITAADGQYRTVSSIPTGLSTELVRRTHGTAY